MEYNPDINYEYKKALVQQHSQQIDGVVIIQDTREIENFKTSTISNFKKTEVVKAIIQHIKSMNIETAYYLTAELICIGQFTQIWETIIFFFGKHIHIANPKLAVYLSTRLDSFKKIFNKCIEQHTNIIDLRNDVIVRKLFAEIICILCDSKKSTAIEITTINKLEFENIENVQFMFKATSADFAKPFIRQGDPKEIYIALNEFVYHITLPHFNHGQACYWLEWILYYDQLCKKKKEKCICCVRPFVDVEAKFQTEPIWIIWDILLSISKKSIYHKCIHKIVTSLLNLFSMQFIASSIKKRKYLIYFAMVLIGTIRCEFLNDDLVNPTKWSKYEIMIENTNPIYEQIKTHEIIQSVGNNNTDIYDISNIPGFELLDNCDDDEM